MTPPKPAQTAEPVSQDSPRSEPAAEHRSVQLTRLLAEMVHVNDVPLGDAWSPVLRPGATIGRFRLVRELGRGGFGVVYEAEDGDLGRTVAVKVVRPGTRIATRGREWMQREAEAVARLNHPNIVTLHDFGQAPEGPYLVFELLRGDSLARRLEREKTLEFEQVIDLGVAITRALVHAHAAGVVHRDLKPGNVHLGDDGEVKVLDFGFAHLFGRGGIGDGGTPAYMAPEQWEGEGGDARVDLFALGIILHQCLAGALPYRVDKDWSEAQEPGPTPALPRRAAPRALRALVRRLLDRDAARRPASAREARDALLAIQQAHAGRTRRRTLVATSSVALTAIALSAWLALDREPPPGEQLKAVLGAMENRAGDPTLDAVPGLLAAALEPSKRVRLVAPARLAAVSREAGLGEPGRLDAERARNLARIAGAGLVLLPSAEPGEHGPVLSVRAVESETGKELFEATADLWSASGMSDGVDQLAERIRREAKERRADRRVRRPVAEAVTASPEAARWYYAGVDCMERARAFAGPYESCVSALDRALALDPAFPLAHYRLALVGSTAGAKDDVGLRHVDAAMRGAGRLGPRERRLVEALQARIDGRFQEAHRLYDLVLAENGDDVEALEGAGDLLWRQGRWAECVPYYEKLVALMPDREDPLATLAEALGRLGRFDELRSLRALVFGRPDSPARSQGLVDVHLWLGEPDVALAEARRAFELRGTTEALLLQKAAVAAGEYAEAAKAARALQDRARGSVQLARLLAAQGQLRDALALNEAAYAEYPEPIVNERHYIGAHLSMVAWDRKRVWPFAARAAAVNPEYAADLAVPLALLGDIDHARALGQHLAPGSVAAEELAALLAWRAGDVNGALTRLAAAEVRDAWPMDGVPPAYLFAEVSASAGNDREVLAAVRRFLRLPPRGAWRSFAFPRALYLAAKAEKNIGDDAAALERVDRLLRIVGEADRDVPLARDARALRSSLAAPQGIRVRQ
ncbi:serine/threonine protein kinase with TPR repeats [Anaeromyxobacter dehalogenans 2CP-1]|uniref:Serine/threonine protein kinase with TPR repeats n=1 Tax=Anaeromyxobacter dehalogenans (strain ATCC BAA-258 / DSM 21875 / 2CP-1) TaxID=455488 RepID=B8J6J4_ANAD2|nr:protein kinase [Anaeromyxobacter dehalogenans]ACL65175.1 serine/threonine protein kinase with TPR repeats [Anaeromyxobacter dehalogenans 2CP-1]